MVLREEIAREIERIPTCGNVSASDMRELAASTARGKDNYMSKYFETQENFE